MRTFGAFVKKEFYHILRDHRTVLILLVMPIVMIMLFGFAISTEINNINVVAVVPKQSESIRQVIDRVESNAYFHLVGQYTTAQHVEEMMRAGDADVAIVFADDFDKQPSLQLLIDGANPNTATMETAYISGVIMTHLRDMIKNTGGGEGIEIHMRMLYNPQMKSAYNFVPGIMGLIFILICALMTSVSIVREKEQGTMEVLLVSPVKPIYIIIAKMIPYFTISSFNLLTILLLSYFVLDIPLTGGVLSVCILALIYIILSLSLGLTISTIVNTQIAAMLSSVIVLMVPVMMLSGMLFPLESMPMVLQVISNIVPARWFIAAARKVMIEGQDLLQVGKEVAVLSGMTILLIAFALKNFKNKLD